nr:MAG TPA: hypothetical protein [Bacteriophage sp.]
MEIDAQKSLILQQLFKGGNSKNDRIYKFKHWWRSWLR